MNSACDENQAADVVEGGTTMNLLRTEGLP